MKQAVKILLSVVLALVLSCAGSGLSLIHCLHSGTTTLGGYSSSCCSHYGEDRCCGTSISKTPCMEVSLMQFSPTIDSSRLSVDIPVQPLPFCSCLQVPDATVLTATTGRTSHLPDGIPLPPRLYLNLNCTLLI